MKIQSKDVLLFLSLFASCSGCKQDADPATTLTAPACLIATQTMKELISPSQPSRLDLETVSINGESFQVGTTQKSVYTYDKQGRIVTEYNEYAGSQAQYASAKADSVFYQYSPTEVSIRTVSFADTGKTERIYAVALNSQGLAEKAYAAGKVTYDKDGYIIALNDSYEIPEKVDNGNIVEWVLYLEGPLTEGYVYRNYYDLNKPGLPPVKPFYGKPSRNLILKYTVEHKMYQDASPVIYTATYSYTFDSYGRVTRRIERGKDEEFGYIFGGNAVTVIDFIYTCP